MIVVLIGLLAGACAQAPARWSASTRAGMVRPPACVTVFFVDGFDAVEMDRMLAAGRLPNIQRIFVDGGVRVRSAVASLPPITYPNAVAMITGLYPGHHGVVGNLWFDRDACLFRNYGFASRYRQSNEDFTGQTIFELLPDELTATIQDHTRRGADIIIDNWAQTGVDWFLENYSDVDARVGTCFPKVAAQARRAGRWPVVYWNYFPAPDEYAHPAGSASPDYEDALVVMDAALGQLVADEEAADVADKRYYVLLSDHGHVPLQPDAWLDLKTWLETTWQRRVRTECCQSGGKAGRCRVLAQYDTVLIVGASRRAVIHLRGPGGWDDPASAALIERMVGGPLAPDEPGIVTFPQVRIACTRAGENAVRVVSRDAAARVERRTVNGERQFRIVPVNPAISDDAFGYRHDAALAAFVDAGWHDSQAWLAATASEEIRDFVPQIVALFDSPRAGDIVAFAADHSSFEPDWLGGHGSCLARDMQIPLYFAGGDLPRGAEIPVGRLVDVMPTALDLIGKGERISQAGAIDGVSLLPQLRAAAPAR